MTPHRIPSRVAHLLHDMAEHRPGAHQHAARSATPRAEAFAIGLGCTGRGMARRRVIPEWER